jgi:hypothetical protein
MLANKKSCLMCSRTIYSSESECRNCRDFPLLWGDLIGVFHKNGIDPELLRDMLSEFLAWRVEDGDDLELFFGNGKSEKEIDQLFDDLHEYKYG